MTKSKKTKQEQRRDLYKNILKLHEKAWTLGMTKTVNKLRDAHSTAFVELINSNDD